MIRINDKIVELLNENDELVLEQQFHADEFIWVVRSKEPIILHRENNETFYDELSEIMNNDYTFQSGVPSLKTQNKLIWFSDQYCDLEDEDSVKRINRLVIKKNDDTFKISVSNPFLEELNIKKSIYIIAFSPLYNGYFTRNTKTNLTLQDDMARIYQKLLHEKGRRLK